MHFSTYSLFISILNFHILAKAPKCNTLTLIQIQGVQELIKSINRDKIQERMVRIQVPSSANDFLLDLKQICKP